MRYLLTPLSLLLAVVVSTPAEEIQIPARQRFATAGVSETPDFQRHVMPLLGRLGCSGRACHGSFQGRGGFRLSLFGYDPQFDHAALTKVESDSGETLVNRDDVAASLLLTYPTDEGAHEGGERFQAGSWEHELLAAWIRGGAQGIDKAARLKRLEVEPSELLFGRPGEETQLRVIAHWEDGGREDVTCLARFQTNNEAIVNIDAQGHVTSVGRGDTHVVAFYDNGVTAVPVLMPVTDLVGDKYPPVETPTRIDELVVSKLQKLGIVPSSTCGDADFLRRVSLDVAGTLPTAEEAEAFLADPSPDKRARKIDELLERPAYAAWWATKFCDLTGNNPQSMGEVAFQNEQAAQWYRWTYARMRENIPYDELVERMLLAVSREDTQSYEDYAAEMTSYVRKEDPADFASRKTMPHYWSRRTFRTAEDRALGVAYAFLGIRIQCAQCHKHPFDQWTQPDFQQFTQFFRGVNYNVSREARDAYDRMQEELGLKNKNGGDARRMMTKLAREGTSVPFRELFVAPAPNRNARGNGLTARAPTGKLLAAEEVDLARWDDPRQPVMDWMRRKDNAWFARALVNRAWAHYFHAGIIDPPDDLNLANPPSNAPLLDYLAQGFVASGYDMKWVHREIANSRTYQLSWQPNDTNQADRRNFSRMIPRRLPAEVAYDALIQATSSAEKLAGLQADPTQRAISHASVTNGGNRYAMTVFGKPARETTCDCERSAQPTLLQSVYLQNDRDVLAMIDRGGWLAGLSRETNRGGLDIERLIRDCYLRTVTRPPTDEELAESVAYVRQVARPIDGVRDLLWALLNTKEFVVNH
ncbi:MAG: DUF1549 and DUF1553 domain-containing protein [Pirellulaceae bacterium]